MATIWFWSALAILTLTFLGALPGTRDLVRPLISMISTLLVEVIKFIGGYVIWLVKRILSAHIEIIRHLLHGRSYFDPAGKVRDE